MDRVIIYGWGRLGASREAAALRAAVGPVALERSLVGSFAASPLAVGSGSYAPAVTPEVRTH